MNAIYPWQRQQWDGLQQMRMRGRLPHALLLGGPAGLGKSQFAARLAVGLLCSSPAPDGSACGACAACQLTTAGNHPDLRLVRPEEQGKAIKIDQIRDLLDFVNLKSHFSGIRVAVIDPAEAMNRNAANSLLKTLEEPPPDTLILLVADQPVRLPATIRSRCQLLRFATDDATAREWLATALEGDYDLDTLMAIAGNRPLAAVDLVNGGEYAGRQPVLEALRDLRSGRAEPVTVAAQWTRTGAGRIYRTLNLLLLDLARIKSQREPAALVNADLRQNLNELAKGLDLRRIFAANDRLAEGQRLLGAGSNLREQDLLEDFTLDWVTD
jgi:DNA polymerase-3 subunit delta'